MHVEGYVFSPAPSSAALTAPARADRVLVSMLPLGRRQVARAAARNAAERNARTVHRARAARDRQGGRRAGAV